MFQKILVANDLTPHSTAVLQTALRLASAMGGGTVTVVHVIEKPSETSHWLSPLFDEEMRTYQTALQREEESARTMIAGAITAAGGDPEQIAVEVCTGRAADTVVALAAELEVELIVVGTRGREGVIGSVAERITRSARRPVLVIPVAAPHPA